MEKRGGEKLSSKVIIRKEGGIRVNPRVYPRRSASTSGFSFVEVLMVVAILSILGLTSILYFGGFKQETELLVQAEKIVSVIREAQTLSMTGEATSTWGVHFDTTVGNQNFIDVFHGTSHAAATVTSPIYLPSNLRFSNITLNSSTSTIFFDRVTGRTSQYGTATSSQALCITTDVDPTACKISIRINSLGKIDWQ